MDGSRSARPAPTRRRRHRLGLVLAWVVVIAALTTNLVFSEQGVRAELRERFQLRATVAARFVERFVDRQADRQRADAIRLLAGPSVGQDDLARVSAALGFASAVLVDGRGRVLAVDPPAPGVVGTDLSAGDEHLDRALRGDRPAVSAVLAPGAGPQRVVALAVPFETDSGRRVLSGTFDLRQHPLEDYIDHAVSLPGAKVDLVEASGVVLASSTPGSPAGGPGPLDPALARVAAGADQATVDAGGQALFATGRSVPGTPWRLVAAAPVRVLDRPVAGVRTWGPRGLLLALALASAAALLAVARLIEAREALRASETRYREVFSHSVVGMLVSQLDGRLTRVNRAFCELVGRSEQELLGGTWARLTHPDDMVKSREMAERALTGELNGYTIDKRYLHADGHVLHVLVSVSLVRDDDGRPLHFTTQVLDQTGRHGAEQARASMAAIVQSSTDAILAKDLDGTVTIWNPAAEALYGWTAEEMIGQKIHRIAPEDRHGEVDEILAAIAEGRTVRHFETVRRRKDGTIVPVSLTVSPIQHGGRIVGASVIGRDITQRRQWENALADRASILEVANAELRETNQLKSDLVAMLSHDVGQPLSVIRGYAEMLDDDWERTGEADRTRMLAAIATAAGRLTTLVDDVLSMARTDALAIRANPVPVRVADAVAQAVAAVGDTVPGLVVESVGTSMVVVDPAHLQQVLVNFLTNAGKYGRPPVVVTAVEAGGQIELRVSDHGPGVPAAFVPHLFDRFTRAGEAAGGAEGSGLGLFIVRKLVEANGGQAGYEPDHAAGACFVVRLKRATVDEAGDRSVPADALASGHGAVLE